jgi:hypothetical protein
MATHKVVFEIEVDAEDSLDAAQTVRDWVRNHYIQFYVQNTHTKKIVSVDFENEIEDAVTTVTDYTPLIQI